MHSLDHPNIVKLLETLEDEHSKKIYMVMEYCSKGAVLSAEYWKAHKNSVNNWLEEDSPEHSNKPRRLSPYQARKYFIDVIQGLHYRNLD